MTMIILVIQIKALSAHLCGVDTQQRACWTLHNYLHPLRINCFWEYVQNQNRVVLSKTNPSQHWICGNDSSFSLVPLSQCGASVLRHIHWGLTKWCVHVHLVRELAFIWTVFFYLFIFFVQALARCVNSSSNQLCIFYAYWEQWLIKTWGKPKDF